MEEGLLCCSVRCVVEVVASMKLGSELELELKLESESVSSLLQMESSMEVLSES